MERMDMRREDLGDLLNLIAIDEEGSFTKAAARLGISQSALSHAIRRLEERLGVSLLSRTTRNVAPTQAGEDLLETVRPAFAEISNRLLVLNSARETPAGSIRITTPEHAARSILWPAVNKITSAFPEIRIELNVESALTDIVSERFDAGVRLGEQLAKDMIAVRISPPLRMATVATPGYFERRPKPETPHDLAHHACINLRLMSSGGLYAWEFERDGRALKVRTEGQLAFNRVPLILDAAMAGQGIAHVLQDHVVQPIADGTLVRVLEDWCPPFSGYHLYYPSRRQHSPALRILIEALRQHD